MSQPHIYYNASRGLIFDLCSNTDVFLVQIGHRWVPEGADRCATVTPVRPGWTLHAGILTITRCSGDRIYYSDY